MKDGLEKTAAAHHLDVVTTPPVGRQGVISALPDGAQVISKAFESKQGDPPQAAPTGEGYAQVLRHLAPVSCDIVRPADGEVKLASAAGLADYDGAVMTGSALNIYDGGAHIERQLMPVEAVMCGMPAESVTIVTVPDDLGARAADAVSAVVNVSAPSIGSTTATLRTVRTFMRSTPLLNQKSQFHPPYDDPRLCGCGWPRPPRTFCINRLPALNPARPAPLASARPPAAPGCPPKG